MDILSTPTTSHQALPTGVIRLACSDFVVDEQLGFEPEGDGEHLWLKIRKTGQNTRDVAAALARALGLQERLVNYSGLKDKIAVTTQWFSVPWPIRSDLPTLSGGDGWQLLALARGRKRLRSGAHRSNRFEIVIRRFCGSREVFDERVECLRERGFPNYFGQQRFGRGGANIDQARRLFGGKMKASRFKRGLYLSAARSHLFNLVLGERVSSQSWNRVLDGEVLMLDGSNSRFGADADLAQLQRRCDDFDVHPSGPLAGSGESPARGEVATLESRVLRDSDDLVDGLQRAGLRHERRALRAIARDLRSQWLADDSVSLGFELPRGVYATSLLQELVELVRADNP